MKNSPCYKCKKRSVGCHSTCKSYDSWKKELEDIKKKTETQRILDYIPEYIIKRKYRRK